MNSTLKTFLAAALLVTPLVGCSDALSEDPTTVETASELRGERDEREAERQQTRVDRDLTRAQVDRMPTRQTDYNRRVVLHRLELQCQSDCTSRARSLYNKCLDRTDERTCVGFAHEAARECVADFCGR